MSNLEAKFEALELQMTTQQTAVINALDAILEALGAPPPTATVTLSTVAAQLTTMNNNIAAIITGNTGFYAALLDAVGAINTNTDTIITNNSLNAQRLISAILSTACPCTTTAPLLAPPIDVTPTTLVDEAKCRRIQFYLSVFGNWLYKIANYGGAGAFITGDILATLLAAAATEAGIVATGAEVGAVGGIPGVVVGAVVGLLIGAVAIVGGSVLLDYATQFNSVEMKAALLAAMYTATNADEGYTAFKSIITANMSTIPAEIIYSLWWSAWSNDVYSGVPVVDDSAFDGSICVPVSSGCHTVPVESVTANVGTGDEVLVYAAIWPSAFTPTALRPDGVRSWSKPVFARLAVGTTITIRRTAGTAGAIYIYDADGGVTLLANASATATTLVIPRTGTGVTIQAPDTGVWSAEFEVCFV